MATAPKPLRVILCGAPPGEADAARRALERSGIPVVSRTVVDTAALGLALQAPLDLLLVWDRPVATDEADAPGGLRAGEVVDLVGELARRAPLVVLTSPERDAPALDLAALHPIGLGAAAIVHRDRLAPLAAIARTVQTDARRRELVDLARASAHDLNNMVAPIPLATRMLVDSVNDPGALSLLETIETSIERVTAAVDSLYRCALWSAGEMDVRSAPAPLRHLIEIVARAVRDAFPELRVEIDYPPDLPPVAAAADEVRQLLLCLGLAAAGVAGGASTLRPGATVSIEGMAGAVTVGTEGEVVVVVRPAATPAVVAELARSAERLGGTLEAAGSGEGDGHRLRLPAARVSRSGRV